MTGQRFLSFAAVATLAAGLYLIGDQAYLRAKAWLAEKLVARAFALHLADGRPHRPWKWADFHPVARVDLDRLGVHRFVLSSAAGSAMAFGLGRVDGTPAPGRPGRCTLAGHRDTWAAFLRDVRTGDLVRITTPDGRQEYRVTASRVVDRSELGVLAAEDGGARLTLVTCYPFSGVTRGPWRYVVDCEPLPVAADDLHSGRPRVIRAGPPRAGRAALPVGCAPAAATSETMREGGALRDGALAAAPAGRSVPVLRRRAKPRAHHAAVVALPDPDA